MKLIIGQQLVEPDDAAQFAEESLFLHRRRDGEIGQAVVIFVHGLGGSRYGTWQNFPSFLYQDLAETDIGLYAYRTALKRLRFWASIELEDEGTVLADMLRDLASDYATIILVAHSMGGILSKVAIKDLIDRNDHATLSGLRGLFLMATPQIGSFWVPNILPWFSKDMRALWPHGRLVAAVTQTFTNRVTSELGIAISGRFSIPVWAVLAADDIWVSKLSAGLSIPDAQKKRVHGSHTRIVKPQTKDSDAYQWVLGHIRTMIQPPPGQGPAPQPPHPLCGGSPSIFVSYSSKDKGFAVRLSGDLESFGVRVWIDQGELQIGDSLLERISEAISSVDYLAVILSPASVKSPWVQKEVEIAMNQEIKGRRVKVLPLLTKQCELPSFLETKVYADFTRPELYARSLRAVLNSLGMPTEMDRPSESAVTHASLFSAEDIAGLEGAVQPNVMDAFRHLATRFQNAYRRPEHRQRLQGLVTCYVAAASNLKSLIERLREEQGQEPVSAEVSLTSEINGGLGRYCTELNICVNQRTMASRDVGCTESELLQLKSDDCVPDLIAAAEHVASAVLDALSDRLNREIAAEGGSNAGYPTICCQMVQNSMPLVEILPTLAVGILKLPFWILAEPDASLWVLHEVAHLFWSFVWADLASARDFRSLWNSINVDVRHMLLEVLCDYTAVSLGLPQESWDNVDGTSSLLEQLARRSVPPSEHSALRIQLMFRLTLAGMVQRIGRHGNEAFSAFEDLLAKDMRETADQDVQAWHRYTLSVVASLRKLVETGPGLSIALRAVYALGASGSCGPLIRQYRDAIDAAKPEEAGK